MIQSKIRFGIIGCSSIAERITIPAILEAKDSTLQFIGSRDLCKAKKFAKNFFCDSYGSYENVLRDDSVDAVYISLPIGLQENWVIRAANAGKHIICEKSATISYRSAKKMLEVCSKNNIRLMEGFSFRFHPQHEKILKIINDKRFGKVFSFASSFGFNLSYSPKNFRYKRSLGGGALNDIGCYPICASRILFQEKPLSIVCKLFYNKKFNVDTKGSMYMIYPNNKIAFGNFGFENHFQSTYSILSSNGLISSEWAFNIKKNISAKIRFHNQNKLKNIIIKPVDQSKLMIQEFCYGIQKGKTSFNYEEDLLTQARIMEAARLSHLKNCIIHLNEVN